MARLIELIGTVIFGALLALLVVRLLKPQTTRELLGRPPSFFELLDELGLCVARVRSCADGKEWELQEFDDYLLSRPLQTKESS